MDWNDRYQVRDTPWDKGEAAPPLSEWMQKHGPLEGEVLVPGCGSGHDVRAIAAASPKCLVTGLDIAPNALKEASRYPTVGREVYQCGDIFSLPEPLQNRFDWVFEHTLFCAIQPGQRPAYVPAIASALKPDGLLLAIFFLNPWDPGDEIPEAGGPPFGVTEEELDSLFIPRFQLVGEFRPKAAFPGREGREIVRLLRLRD